jgi:nicotinamidase-related amidase
MLREALEFRFLSRAVRHMNSSSSIRLQTGDALIAVDVQNDFLPGGSLAAPEGDAVVPVLNRYLAAFAARALPVFATRDWHPPNHCSFKAQGGLATDYCVLNTVRDALAEGFEVLLLADAIRAVDLKAGDGARAQGEMQKLGARPIRYEDLAP